MTTDYLERTLSQYRKKGVLVDTNLLPLYFVGKYDPERISRYKRTKVYTVDDFALLDSFIDHLDCVITTPNILTEVSNLSAQLPENVHASYFQEFRQQIQVLQEHYVPSTTASVSDHFERFGLTDAAIVELSKNDHLVLTDDAKLVALLQGLQIDAVNFNHVRTMWRPKTKK